MDVSLHRRYNDDSCKAAFNAILDVQFSGTEVEPVTRAEAKSWCRIDVDDDNSLIDSLLTAARLVCEQYCNISFTSRTVTAVLNNSCGNIFLPYGPVSGTVTMTDRDGNTVTDPKVRGSLFKFIESPCLDYLQVSYSAGYSTLPPNLKTAVLSQIAWIYENRGDANVAGTLSMGSKMILKLLRRV